MGRLVNAGWEVTALGERFGHDTRTLRGWAEALLCADPAAMLRGLSGRGADGKVTAEIVEFVLDWWDELCVRARSFRTRILARVAQVFKVRVSWEALRPALLARRRARAAEERATAAGNVCPAMGCAAREKGKAEPGGDSQPVAGPVAAEPVEVPATEAAAGTLRLDSGSRLPATPCANGTDCEKETGLDPQPVPGPTAAMRPPLPLPAVIPGGSAVPARGPVLVHPELGEGRKLNAGRFGPRTGDYLRLPKAGDRRDTQPIAGFDRRSACASLCGSR